MPFIPPDALPAGRITDDVVERKLYSRDLAPVPAILSRPFFRTTPDVVVRPASTEQAAAVLAEATAQRVPVTPRAAASTSYYNTVPVRGGIVMDVNDLRGEIRLDPARGIVRVGPALTWCELEDALNQQGFAVKSYPSSAVSATVGGWLSMEGAGLGTLAYGLLGELVESLEIVLPGGSAVRVTRESDPPLDWFVSAEGTLGVITEVELSVRPLPAAHAEGLYSCANSADLAASMSALAAAEPRPFTVFFADPGYLQLMARAGFGVPVEGRPGGSSVLLASYQGDAAEVEWGRRNLSGLQGRELPEEAALDEWNLRLYHLRTKRAGPSLLAAEMWLPLAGLSGYLGDAAALAQQNRVIIGTYGLAIGRGEALVMSLYPADERDEIPYLAAIGFTKRLHDLGARHGGRPYGVGLWNTPYLGRLHSRNRLAELRRRKARLDPAGIMNPGKLYAASFPLWPIAFTPGAAVLSLAYRAMGGGRAA